MTSSLRSLRHVRAIGALGVLALLAASWMTTHAAAQPARSITPTRGKVVYESHCVECHGRDGKGDGPAAHVLTPRPRDFSTARYKIRTTETGSLPTNDDLARSIRQGLAGSAMPAWQAVLSDGEILAVVEYVKAFSPRFATETPQTIAFAPVPTSPESVARGAAVFDKLQCAKCHGTDGRGTGAVATTFEDDWRQPLRAADLTEPWTFHGGAAAGDVYMRFRSGMSGTPMPSFKDAAKDVEMWDLANYVVSLARKPVWEMNAAEVTAFYARKAAEAKANPVARGAYLVETLGCTLCHSPVTADNHAIPGMQLAGGVHFHIEPYGDFSTGNLTSDQETGLGRWTDDEIKAVITRGVLRDGTRLLPFPMDWPSFSTMPADDINAIVAYLRTVPPVRNKVPAPRWTPLPVHLWGKFKVLILGEDPPFTMFGGNAGSAPEAR